MTDETPKPRAVLLTGNDAMSMLIDIYLDAFTTGAASVLATLAPHIEEEKADRFVESMVTDLSEDPLAIEVIRGEIRERMTGVDTGTKTLTLPNPGAES